jgi:hypothetical protein
MCMQGWFNGMATTLPYLSVLSEPSFDNKQKKYRIKKIVPLILSVLYNNFCDFGENGGGKKSREDEGNDIVPLLHVDISNYVFQSNYANMYIFIFDFTIICVFSLCEYRYSNKIALCKEQ